MAKSNITPPLYRTLELYCEWLNSFKVGDDYDYTVENFDSDKNPYAEITRIITYKADEFMVEVFEIYDGDEGGHTVLTVYFEIDGKNVNNRPIHATQLFDTMLTHWLLEGKIITEKEST